MKHAASIAFDVAPDDFVVRRLPAPWHEPGLLWLYIGAADRHRAQILGRVVAADDLDLAELERAAGRSFSKACVIFNSVILDDTLLNQGHGVRLYATMAELAAREFEAPIVSSRVARWETSKHAERTWASRRLAERVLVRGQCAWGGPLPKEAP